MTNKEWLEYLANNAPDELAAWFDAEHVETEERALDGDTDALERKSADLIHEYYKPMVAELQSKVDNLTAERDKLQEQLYIGWECECRLQAERERYRNKFGKCLDYADAIHALMDDEGLA